MVTDSWFRIMLSGVYIIVKHKETIKIKNKGFMNRPPKR